MDKLLKDDLIKEKDMVIFQKGSYLKSCRVIKDRPQKLGRSGRDQLCLNLGGAIGYIFGSSFKLVKSSKKFYSLEICQEQQADNINLDLESGFDNRNIYDDGQNQSLSKDDIRQLVDSGKSGGEVIQTLVQNNKTFASKTKYSQEKYVSKKQKKYVEIVTLHRPSIRLLVQKYYMSDPLKISNLRIDTLSQMMLYANVQSGGRFAVYEAGIQGLITATMLQRIGNNGSLVHIYSGACPHKESVEMMGFTDNELKMLSFISAENLPHFTNETNSLTDISLINNDLPDMVTSVEGESKLSEQLNEKSAKTTIVDDDIPNSLTTIEEENCKPQKARKFIRSKIEDIRRSVEVLSQGLNGIVVACRQHPQSITMSLLTYLKPGHSFVIYSPYKEPLMDLFMAMKNENCINIHLTETWLRNYQILPERTHPEMNMSGGGGYLLTGWKITD